MGLKKLVYGVGINDLDGFSCVKIDGKYVSNPIYMRWANMLKRAACPVYKNKYPTYMDVTVCEEWKFLSKFSEWMNSQDWHGKQLDKDLLVQGNKVYAPDKCIFIDMEVNYLFLRSLSRGVDAPIGVYFNKGRGRYQAQCIHKGKAKYLGLYSDPMQAHAEWQQDKILSILDVIDTQRDERVIAALMSRVENLRSDLENGVETTSL